ncbi:prepilin-type N-terminal cleavage/methylation domain-containing protein [Couchioplanes caeruleus]|uniref:Pilus assembly protein PilA n=2 Tax=Couchioplanes caeruleus TaxID=56438 RepID=A0A1K0GXC6_9ACTN|nr:prepilin-type N-terminal cleavage/methylation domain-containing protein [Couchioplanes caeruleus]OJF16068.1 pilus assembly protein PilA [Couchioplanes caeruleus subsp. caeruleus]ROP29957.1 type IV pilus assembly protein PilA [Couchioplanes caeruleus]
MQDTISRLRAKKDDEGFTLIELLVVVVIIGVLVAIAVPVYLNYRQGAADKSAQSDVRGAISAVEQYYTENGNKYPDAAVAESNEGEDDADETYLNLGDGRKVTLSEQTELGYVPVGDGYLLCAQNKNGSEDTWYLYDSSAGGSVTPQEGAFDSGTCA